MDPVIERLLRDRAIDDVRLSEGMEISEGAGLPLFRVLLHLKLVEPAAAAAAVSAVTGRAVLNLDKGKLPTSPVAHFTAGLCRELRVLPLAFEQGDESVQIILAMSDPTDQNAGERAAAVIGKNVRPVLVDDAALSRAIAKRYDELPAPATLVEATAEVLLLEEVATEPSGERAVVSDVFTGFSDGANERTVIMRAPARDMTLLARNPFLESQHSDTQMTSPLASVRVLFTSRDAKARLRVAADLAPLVKDAMVVDDLERACQQAEGSPPDEAVVHSPRNDVVTAVLLERLARACGHGVVVLSNDEGFAGLSAVRRRVPLPATTAQLAALIIDGLFA